MHTPAGLECRYYYQDFHRGRSLQECRLIGLGAKPSQWEPKLCTHCPVPSILRANACPDMVLEAQVVRQWLGLVRRVGVRAACARHHVEVDDPYVGCGRCHPQAATILQAPQAME